MFPDLLRLTASGLYCPAGDFYVDPWRPVAKAVITHAHSDHARAGSRRYLSTVASEPLLRSRIGQQIELQTLEWGETVQVGGVKVSLHPAGHIRGSCQVRIESAGRVVVITGDFKRQPDPTCESFEPLPCHLLVAESTFAMPVFAWPDPGEVISQIEAWWRSNREVGRASVLYGYALGKSQRILASLDHEIGPLFLHGALVGPTEIYREQGCRLPPCTPVSSADTGTNWSESLIMAVPSAHGTSWLRRFGPVSTAMASGWMTVRGHRRRRNVDRGFVISDHCDWRGLLDTVAECGPEEVWVTHGFTTVAARYLNDIGVRAVALSTRFGGDEEDESGREDDGAVATVGK